MFSFLVTFFFAVPAMHYYDYKLCRNVILEGSILLEKDLGYIEEVPFITYLKDMTVYHMTSMLTVKLE